MLYDAGKIVYGTVKGNGQLVREGWIDLGADTASALIPFVPGGITKLSRGTVEGGETAYRALNEAATPAAKTVDNLASVVKPLDEAPGGARLTDDVALGPRIADEGSPTVDGPRLLNAPKMQDHHLMPRQYQDFFSQRGINIDDFTVSLGQQSHLLGMHGQGLGNMPGGWNKTWGKWISDNPNATAKDIFQQLGGMMDQYNISGLLIKKYRE